MRSSNPALGNKTFEGFAQLEQSEAMTVDGCVNKTAILLGLVSICALWTWNLFYKEQNFAAVSPYLLTGCLGGFIVGLITNFKKQWSAMTAPIYAVLQGFALGAISASMELRFPGIVIQAVSLTFGTLFCLLLAYKSKLIQVTENFKLGIVAATGAVVVVYIIDLVMMLFGTRVPYIHESGLMGIGFSLIVVGIAAFNLVLDFDFIEKGAERGAPKYMEWYGAFGLTVTMIWLYLEILKLLSKTRSRK